MKPEIQTVLMWWSSLEFSVPTYFLRLGVALEEEE